MILIAGRNDVKAQTSVSSYDVIKGLALVLMIIDHIGFVFYPDDALWRAIGRASAPLWLFLIGYAHSARITPALIACAIGLTLFDVGAGYPYLPLNILWTIIGLRALRQLIGDENMTRPLVVGALGAAALAFFPVTAGFYDYGTLALLMMLAGRVARAGSRPLKHVVLFITFMSYVILQQGMFAFEGDDLTRMTLGVAFSFGIMAVFRPHVWTLPASPFFAVIIRLVGRQTLALFVIHLVFFKLVALALPQ